MSSVNMSFTDVKPLVTVLLVAYNHLYTFEKAIESILEQKTNFEFKIWVLDDASSDGTSELVKKYAEKFPKKVIPVIRPENLGGIQNVFQALGQIDTKYFATLEGDDYWCDENKLQMQVDILENNSDCSFCCHNSYRRYPNDIGNSNHNTPYIKTKIKSGKYKFPKKICSKQYIEAHYSSRMYRTECLCLNQVKNPVMVCYDIASMFWFLDKGKMYYLNRLMSVYNFNYTGVYSGVDSDTQRYMSANIISQINQAFDYKYNSMLLDFFKKKIPVSFVKTVYMKYFAKKEQLERLYNDLSENFIHKNDKKMNSKTLFEFALPVGKKKRICFEIRREKEM